MTPRDGEAEPPVTLGDYIKAARLRLDLSLDRLAEQLGTSRNTVIRWEKNRHIPDPEYRAKLIAALSLRADLFDELARDGREEARLEPRVAALEQAVERLENHLYGRGAVQGR